MFKMTLENKSILITGAAQRVGRALALAAADAGANLIIHYGTSQSEALKTQAAIQAKGRQAHLLQADLNDLEQTLQLIERASQIHSIYALVNNASIFEPLTWQDTTPQDWQRNLQVNLTAPFFLSQAFARQLPDGESGRIVNLLDWRALRPAADHLPYTISKAALAALTRSLAAALAPRIQVNGLALGAVLPPSDGGDTQGVLKNVPAQRWANLEEICQALLFLLEGPEYITGEIIHLDGGRHII